MSKLVIRAVFLVAVALPLCGCSDERQRDHDACMLKAIEIYKPEMVEVHDPSGRYVYRCMMAAGYLLDDNIKACTAYGGPNPSNIQPLAMVAMIPGCWQSKKSWWGR